MERSFVKDVFLEKYKHRLDRKRDRSFQKIFEILEKTQNERFMIVETGTTRKKDNFRGDGQSTILFDEFVNYYDGAVISIDIDPTACRLARRLTSDKTCVLDGDSVDILNQLDHNTIEQIDLLYLDSYDVNFNDTHPSSLHHLKELTTVYSRLKEGCIIAVDDNINDTGKGKYIKEFFDHISCEKIVDEYQLVYIKK